MLMQFLQLRGPLCRFIVGELDAKSIEQAIVIGSAQEEAHNLEQTLRQTLAIIISNFLERGFDSVDLLGP